MILIVDDFRDSADALCRLLHREGYPCEIATDGTEALARIRLHPREQPLLVILDQMMPVMSGIEVLREIRRDPAIAHTTVIMFSAGFDAEARDEAITLGAVAWLLKGGSATALEELMATAKRHYEKIGGVPAAKPE